MVRRRCKCAPMSWASSDELLLMGGILRSTCCQGMDSPMIGRALKVPEISFAWLNALPSLGFFLFDLTFEEYTARFVCAKLQFIDQEETP